MPTRPAASRLLEGYALVAVLAGLFAALGSRPLWDPPELETAELSRRIAHGLFGAEALGSPGEAVPTRGELGRGELPFLLVALAFRLFGLSAGAGRAAFALCGLLGIAALTLVVRRFASRRAAALAALALGTLPLYALQARTLLGDITTLAAGSVAFAGLFLFVYDTRAFRGLGALLSVIGLGAGFLSRGPLIGVAPAALGVGLTWLAGSLAAPMNGGASRRAGGFVLALGALAVVLGVVALVRTPVGEYSLWIGSARHGFAAAPTFETAVRDLLHAAFPWSALFVPALGAVLATSGAVSATNATNATNAPERTLLGLSALSAVAVSAIAQTALGASIGATPYAAAFALAVVVALALDEVDRQPGSSPLFGALAFLIGFLLILDFRNLPDKLLVAVGAETGTLPQSFDRGGFSGFAVSAVAVLGAAALLLAGSAGEIGFRVREYRRWFRCLRELWQGRLLFGAIALGSALLGLDLALTLGALSDNPAFERGEHWFVRAGWLALLAAVLWPLVARLARDCTRWVVARFHLGRGASAAVLLSLLGLGQSLFFVPRWLTPLSEAPVLSAYERYARPGEPLVLLDDVLPVARYRSDPRLSRTHGLERALGQLEPKREKRAFLVLQAGDLARVNAAFRARTNPRANLYVLDAPPSALLLATNRLRAGERDHNPFREFFRAEPAVAAHPVDYEFDERLELVAWEIRDLDDRARDSLIGGEPYDLLLFFHVKERLADDWQVFVHVDGFQQRLNADHAPLAGVQPTSSWLAGDWVVDRHRFRIDASFLAGVYGLYAGLYRGDERAKLTRGAGSDERAFLGELRVD